jgi:hypothetical protein
MEPEGSSPHSQEPLTCPYPEPDPRHLWMCRNMIKFLRWRVVSTSPNPQAGRPPLVGCLRMLIQYICGYPSYLEAVLPSATWARAMPWWQWPTYHCDRNPLIMNVYVKCLELQAVSKGSQPRPKANRIHATEVYWLPRRCCSNDNIVGY